MPYANPRAPWTCSGQARRSRGCGSTRASTTARTGATDPPRAAREVDARTVAVRGVAYMPFVFCKTLPHDALTCMATEEHARALLEATSRDAQSSSRVPDIVKAENSRALEGLYTTQHRRLRVDLVCPGHRNVR